MFLFCLVRAAELASPSAPRAASAYLLTSCLISSALTKGHTDASKQIMKKEQMHQNEEHRQQMCPLKKTLLLKHLPLHFTSLGGH